MKSEKIIPVERLDGVVMTDRMLSAFPGEELKNHTHTIITIIKKSAKQNGRLDILFLHL